MRLFKAVDAHDTVGTNRAVIGPWRHCDWLAPRPGDVLGPLSFGEPTADQFRDDIEARFFAYYLKDEGSLATMPQVMAFETGGAGWRGYAGWPPSVSASARALFLDGDRHLSWTVGSSGIDSYVSDPAKPVPYARRPIGFFTGRGLETDIDHERARSLFIIEDQRFAQDRPDVLTWQSPPLDRDMVLIGSAVLDMFAETSGTDVDWIAQLIDLYPEDNDPRWSGYRLPVTRGALRASLRQGLDAPHAVRQRRTEAYRIEFLDRNHRFRKGHRIMLQLQSSWFPYLARNPQRFVPGAAANSGDFTTVTNRIHRGGTRPSRLLLPLSPAEAGNGSWQPGE
jgi:putative CocE/NonD family hydrolase